jgi:hypothetical protein
MSRIYITNCSFTKDSNLENTIIKVTPDKLYTATSIQRFMRRCQESGVNWAIFSDKYDIVFPTDKIPWYEKDPDDVKESEYQVLFHNFAEKIWIYNEIWFYYNPGRFHPLYKRLLKDAKIKGMGIHLFSHLAEIKQ